MTDLPDLIILDVGHGNSALLRDTNGVLVVDCSRGAALNDAIREMGITVIENVLISHADADHSGGLIGLLLNLDVAVRNVYINQDATKSSRTWHALRSALADARKRGSTRIHPSLSTNDSGNLSVGEVKVEILAPSPELLLSGVGGRDLEERSLTSNSLSVVVRLLHERHAIALLPGDIDGVALKNILEEGKDLRADAILSG